MNTTKIVKKYKKKPTKLIQIRVSEKEYEEIVNYFKEHELTRRTWLLDKIKYK